MRPLIIFLFTFLLAMGPLPEFMAHGALNRVWKPTLPQYPLDFKQCVSVAQPNRNSFSFLNACPERVYINVCVRDIFGNTKLYQSGNRIQVGGRFIINSFYEVRGISWTADPYNPLIPPPCTHPTLDKKA